MNTAKLIKVFRAKQKLYQRDPVLFAKEVVGYEADVWQADTLRDLADPDCRRVSVRSGQGVGKTATEAIALLWFLSCFPFARVVATAPTRQQLNDVLWSEIAKWQASSLAKAQAFIEGRAGNPQKISHWRYRDDDWTEYLICEVRVDLGEG